MQVYYQLVYLLLQEETLILLHMKQDSSITFLHHFYLSVHTVLVQDKERLKLAKRTGYGCY